MGLALLHSLNDGTHMTIKDYRVTLMHDGSNVKLELRADKSKDIADDSATRFDDGGMKNRDLTNPPEHVGLAGKITAPDAANPATVGAKVLAIGDT